MTGGLNRKWDIQAAWDAATAVTAMAFDVPAEIIAAPSRGRGPRPPRNVWTAKKMAVHLAVIIADCDYASLGRHLGLHRDTVASHCADMREASGESDLNEVSAVALERLARFRLQSLAAQRLEGLRAQMAMMEATLCELNALGSAGLPALSGALFSSDDHPTFHPTIPEDHGNVIAMALPGRRPR